MAGLNEEMSSGSGGIGGGIGFLFIVLLLLFWMFGWGNNRVNANEVPVATAAVWGMNNNGCNRVSNCEVEKQTIINTAETNFLIEQRSAQTQLAIQADGNLTRTKIDYYAYEGLKDQLAQERAKVIALEGRVYSDAQFNAIKSENAEIKCILNGLPKTAPVYATGVSCGGYPYPGSTCGVV